MKLKHFIFVLCFPCTVFGEVNLNILGGTTLANIDTAGSTGINTHSTSNRQGLAGGVLLNIKSQKSKFGISSGLLYVESGSVLKLTRLSDGLYYDVTLKLPYLQLPLILDFWFSRNFAIGIGGYYAWAAGNLTNVGAVRLGITVPLNISDTFGTQGYSTRDYGYLANVQYKMYLGKKFNLGLIALYQKSLSDFDNSPTFTGKTTNIMALASMGYLF